MSYACPICAAALELQSRYPRYVCGDCAGRARSSDGRALEFFNADFDGAMRPASQIPENHMTAMIAGLTASPAALTKPALAAS